jgi:uncharacterized damage-inducible protein DinB
MLADLLDLFAYNRWATARTLDAAELLTDEQLTRDLGGSFPSVRDTLAHMVAAEWIWLSRWMGDPPGTAPDLSGCTEARALRERWQVLAGAQSAYLAGLTAAALERPVSILTRTGIAAELPLHETLRHVVNHATYHRGQVAAMLRQLGAQPVATDLFLYYAARPAPPEEAGGVPVPPRAG